LHKTVPAGEEASSGVTIQAILPTVHILHTKTRPKRLTLLGSDGKQYKYLLKASARQGGAVWGTDRLPLAGGCPSMHGHV